METCIYRCIWFYICIIYVNTYIYIYVCVDVYIYIYIDVDLRKITHRLLNQAQITRGKLLDLLLIVWALPLGRLLSLWPLHLGSFLHLLFERRVGHGWSEVDQANWELPLFSRHSRGKRLQWKWKNQNHIPWLNWFYVGILMLGSMHSRSWSPSKNLFFEVEHQFFSKIMKKKLMLNAKKPTFQCTLAPRVHRTLCWKLTSKSMDIRLINFKGTQDFK